MRWLDLYCGAGLVADGLIAAGDEVDGVDIKDQPNYPGLFSKADCLWWFARIPPEDVAAGYDAIWASPPCLRHTDMKHAPGAKGDAHPELIAPTREWLKATGLPYVIENVPGAPLINPVSLNGAMFGLGVTVDGVRYHLKRERIFEMNWPFPRPLGEIRVGKPIVTVIGGHARVRSAKAGGRGTADFVGVEGGHRRVMGRAMGLPDDRKVTCSGISDGIPPAYSMWIARQLKLWLAKRPKDMTLEELEYLPQHQGPLRSAAGFPGHFPGDVTGEDIAAFRDRAGRVWDVHLVGRKWVKRLRA